MTDSTTEADGGERGKSLRIFDGQIDHPAGCPRGRTDCAPTSRVASPDFHSYFCCGETNAAPVPEDTFRFCVKSTHDSGPVDMLVNFDQRDVTDAIAVLSGALSSDANRRAQEPA